MKNYISVAALLIAGTAFANADVVVFENPGVTGATNVDVGDLVAGVAAGTSITASLEGGTLSVTNSSGSAGKYWGAGITGTIVDGAALDALAAATGLDASALKGLTSGFSHGHANSSLTFSFTGLSASTDYTFSAVFSKSAESGAVLSVGTGTFVSGNYGSLASDSSWNTLDIGSSVLFDGLNTGDPVAVTFVATTDASGNLSFTVNHKSGVSLIGVTPAAAPEPSAFGLLAGLGALALVASRRRRK